MVSIIAAVGKNGVIGKEGALPWHLSGDMKWFKEKTTGHPIILGRRSFEPRCKLLPNRTTIIVTHQQDYEFPGATIARSLADAIQMAESAPGAEEVFIIGGGQIYTAALQENLVDRMYLTHVDAEVSGDTFFPDFNIANWKVSELQEYKADERNDYDFVVKQYERIK